MMRDLAAEQELAADVRGHLQIAVDEAAIVALWAYTELQWTPGWKFLRRRFLEGLWQEKCLAVDRGRDALKRAAP